jgi:hypothetical protein
MSDTHTLRMVLACPMGENDALAETVGDYLAQLATECWRDGETFSGKKPFGNSDWEGEVELALIAAGLAEGRIEDGYLVESDWHATHRLVLDALQSARLVIP